MENVLHIVSGCSMLAQKGYKGRHHKVCLNIQWALCKKYGVKVCERWYEHKVESVIENDIVKILWDVCIPVDRQIEHQRPDIVVMEKNTNSTLIVPIIIRALGSIPNDLECNLKKLGISCNVESLQKSVLLGTANILKKDPLNNKD